MFWYTSELQVITLLASNMHLRHMLKYVIKFKYVRLPFSSRRINYYPLPLPRKPVTVVNSSWVGKMASSCPSAVQAARPVSCEALRAPDWAR